MRKDRVKIPWRGLQGWSLQAKRGAAHSLPQAPMPPLLWLILTVIDLYVWVIIASAILSWLVAFNVVNTRNAFVTAVINTLDRLTEPALRPIRRIMPNLGGIDISPIILILLLLFTERVLIRFWPASIGI